MAVNNQNIHVVIRILKTALAALPDPSVTLVGKRYRSPFLVLISCILSLRTKDETTLPAAQRLFALADTPEAMVRLPAETIATAIYPVGFYKTKARTIIGICEDILSRFDGRVPDEIETLLMMKGVGRKTANLVLIEGFGKPAMCVDTHVHRISNRFGYVRTRSPEETEQALRRRLPAQYWNDYNAMLVMWGQNVCRPISPLCSRCPLAHICQQRGVSNKR